MKLWIFTSAFFYGKVGTFLLEAYELNKILAQPSPHKVVVLCRYSFQPHPWSVWGEFIGFTMRWGMIDGIIEMVGSKDSFVVIIIPRGEFLVVVCGLAWRISSS